MKKCLLYTVVVMGIALAACDSPGGNGGNTTPEIKGTTLVCLGDSLTAGYGATKPGQDDLTKSYPAYLQTKVNLPVINAGISGNTTAQGLARVDLDVLSRDPHITVILLGANDFFQGVSIAQTKSNLQNIISKIDEEGRKIYVAKFFTDAIALEMAENNAIPEDDMLAALSEYSDMYNALAESKNVTLIEDIWQGVWGIHMSDFVHPNAEGYAVMADNIFNALKPYLQKNGFVKAN